MNINVTCNHQLSPQLTTQWRFNLNRVWPLRRRELDEDHGQNADMIRVVCIAWAYVQAMFCGTCTSIYVSVAACERQKWGNISMFGSCIARISWCFFYIFSAHARILMMRRVPSWIFLRHVYRSKWCILSDDDWWTLSKPILSRGCCPEALPNHVFLILTCWIMFAGIHVFLSFSV